MEINPRFRDLIPALAPEEYAQLEANIVAEGCREPLVTWFSYRGYCNECEKETDWRPGDGNTECERCGYGVAEENPGVLLDGHNRLEICNRHGIDFDIVTLEFSDEDAAAIWIIKNQFGRRNLAPFTRVELALKLEPLVAARAKANQKKSPGRGKKGQHKCADLLETREEVAKAAGVSRRLIDEGKLVAAHADDETKARLRTNQVSLHRIAKDIKEKKAKQVRQEKRTEAAKDAPSEDSRIVVGDFREHADKIADGSLSLIFTDPPYDRKASEVLPDLAAFAAAKLADGGSLICYVGHRQLPSALDAFRKHLRYWWVIACVHSGRSSVMREYGINAKWKPVLWFVKGTRDDNSVMVNDAMSGGEEKEHHDWQQAESEAAYWIDKLCPADGLVCDPYLGSGTTAKAAESLGRKWVGFEVNEETAAIARKRLAG